MDFCFTKLLLFRELFYPLTRQHETPHEKLTILVTANIATMQQLIQNKYGIEFQIKY